MARITYTFIFLLLLPFSFLSWAHSIARPPYAVNQRASVQDIVTWDGDSIFVRGERILFLSGEFHPFRLPSPGLWLDVFQKIRAIGFSGVSFYVDAALLEGEPGHFRSDGVFALDEFFAAAKEAGIYLLARPGPYINSEVSGGGFPGWFQRLKGHLRSTDQDFVDATRNYISRIGSIISKAQITNGGPVILFQPENEYTACVGTDLSSSNTSACLEGEYMATVESLYRDSGVEVPFVHNDAVPLGNWAPGTGAGAVDIYGFDTYPFGWGNPSCADPSNWDRGRANPTSRFNYTSIKSLSASTPVSIIEFQAGAPDAWGGVGVDQCAALINNQFERIFYKINYSAHVAIMNLYMMYGGTNWGNLGHPSGYTSYDVGAAIREDRQVVREKYSELKLQAYFLQASPEYLTAIPHNAVAGTYTNATGLIISPLLGQQNSSASFYIVRHSDFQTLEVTSYSFNVQTSQGYISIPQLGGTLSLHGRDSKFHVTDYDAGGITLVYSSAEIFTWKKTESKVILLLYGGENELHEFAVSTDLGVPTQNDGQSIKYEQRGGTIVVQWNVTPSRQTVNFGDVLEVHLLWRNDAYNYWVLDLPLPEPAGLYVSPARLESPSSSVIVKAGYLLRSATVEGSSLSLTGDINSTTEIEVIAAPPNCCSELIFNGQKIDSTSNSEQRLTGTIPYVRSNITLPDLSRQEWHYIDSLPEIQPSYDDSEWTICNNTESNNPRQLTTPTSLYASDYGFHAGSLLYRGHFVATGDESSFYLSTQGGYAFGHSIWLNDTFLGSWPGSPLYQDYNQTLSFPSPLQQGSAYILTVLIDHMGLDLQFFVNSETMKNPRGILNYNLSHANGSTTQSDITWKLTGNLGGEQYRDHSRGPLNEGSTFAERQGYHLPGAPTQNWTTLSPLTDGLPASSANNAAVGLFGTEFNLDIPADHDVPISLVFTNTSSDSAASTPANIRTSIYINGWQLGKYVNNIGPQTSYPLHEGILNHNGNNYLAILVWSLGNGGTTNNTNTSTNSTTTTVLKGLRLEATGVVRSGYRKPGLVDGARWEERGGY